MKQCVFESSKLVGNELPLLRKYCIDGVRANEENCRRDAERSTALLTIPAALFGCPVGVKVAHEAARTGKTVKEVVLDLGLMATPEADLMIDPRLMTEPEKMAEALQHCQQRHGAGH